MSARPKAGTVWALRKDFRHYVLPVGESIELCFGNRRIELDRATARLLAKRINECLDATVKK